MGDRCRASPPRLPGSVSSSRLCRTPAKSPGVVVVKPVPGPRCGVRIALSGVHGPAWRNCASRAAPPDPRPKTSTRSGSPVPGVAQISACAIVDCEPGRPDRQPGGVLPRHSPRRQEAQRGSRSRSADQPDGQRRRHEVGCPGEPEGLRAVDSGEQLLTGIPQEGVVADLVRVVLAGVGERVHPPVIRRCLPDPYPRHSVHQRRHAGEGGQRREAEGRVAFGVPGEGQALRPEDAFFQLPRRQLRHARRERAGQDRQAAQRRNAGQHDDPAPSAKPGVLTAHLITIREPLRARARR